jgi:hypothetical protein
MECKDVMAVTAGSISRRTEAQPGRQDGNAQEKKWSYHASQPSLPSPKRRSPALKRPNCVTPGKKE